MSLVLVGGGARSGKSRQALELARACGPRLAFIATAAPGDEEMTARIALHRQQRGPGFTVFEEPCAVASRIESEGGRFDAVVVDCLTIWLSNLMLSGHAAIDQECRRMIEAARSAAARVVLVTNEVGCGIVPENALAREFRDHAGKLNQQAAEAAAEVYWMVFGIPLKVK